MPARITTIICILLSLCNYSIVAGQDYKVVDTSGFNSVTFQEAVKGRTLDRNERKALFNKEFTAALSDVTSNYIGNYASVNVGATKASFATSLIGDGSVFGFNISGSTSDGTLRFVNNNKLNYNFDVGVQYHFIDASKRIRFVLDSEDWDTKRMNRKKLIKDTEKKIEAIQNGENLKKLNTQKRAYQSQINTLKNKIAYTTVGLSGEGDTQRSIHHELILVKLEVLKEKLATLKEYQDDTDRYKNNKRSELAKIENCYSDECIEKRTRLKNDTDVKQTLLNSKQLKNELKTLQEQYDKFDFKVHKKKLETTKKSIEEKLDILNKEIDELKNSKEFLESVERTKFRKALVKHDQTAIETYGSSFNWFSIGAKAGLKSFVLYDAAMPLEEQLESKETANLELTLQYSWHNQNQLEKWKSYLVNAGLGITYGDNFNSLSPLTLRDETIVSGDATTTRTTSSETKVFVGDYQDNVTGLKLYTDIYYFLFDGNLAAIHLYPTANFSEIQKPLFATQIGLILSYKNKDKPGSIVNAELFYALNDIGNRAENDLSLFARNTIGLRLTIPIKFKYEP